MHIIAFLYGVLLPTIVSATALAPTTISNLNQPSETSICPFITPIARLSQQEVIAALLRRQDSQCPAGHFGCSNLGAPQACCATTAICTTDSANHVACCPDGASCTGIIGGATSPGATTASSNQAATTTGSNTGTTGTLVATNGIIVTANPSSSDKVKIEIWNFALAIGSLIAIINSC
jgi:hypothetical protein